MPLLVYRPSTKLWFVLPVGVNVARTTGSELLDENESYTVMVGVLDAELTKMPRSLPAAGLIWAVAVIAV